MGGGGTVGVVVDLTERWTSLLSATYLRYALGEHSDNTKYTFQQRYTLSKDWAIRLELNHFERRDNAKPARGIQREIDMAKGGQTGVAMAVRDGHVLSNVPHAGEL